MVLFFFYTVPSLSFFLSFIYSLTSFRLHLHELSGVPSVQILFFQFPAVLVEVPLYVFATLGLTFFFVRLYGTFAEHLLHSHYKPTLSCFSHLLSAIGVVFVLYFYFHLFIYIFYFSFPAVYTIMISCNVSFLAVSHLMYSRLRTTYTFTIYVLSLPWALLFLRSRFSLTAFPSFSKMWLISFHYNMFSILALLPFSHEYFCVALVPLVGYVKLFLFPFSLLSK